MPSPRTLVCCLAVGAAAAAAPAWNPPTGDWLKSDATDLRVMTWNVQDAICSTAVKTDARNSWNAVVRVIAAMKPDVIIFQECGDNSGNGTGGSGDSAATLETTFGLLVNGGTDPVLGGSVGSWIKKFDASLDYPYIFVSSVSDSFNRNAIISRYPFADLNNDVGPTSKFSNITITSADAYAVGGTGGIRGYQFGEIDLPDDVYAGDLVIGNGHLKANEGGCDDEDEREDAARNIAYWISYFYNGAGTGDSDPNNKIPFDTVNTTLLDANTPVIWGGDFNQVWTLTSCSQVKSPTRWMVEAQTAGGMTDGTDPDGTDSTFDSASHPLTGDTTTQSSSKLDFLCWQDSKATARRQFIFRTDGGWPVGTPFPAPVNTYPPAAQVCTPDAADHRPVLIDFILALTPVVPCPTDLNGDGATDTADLGILISAFGSGGPTGDINGDLTVDTADLGILIAAFGPCP